MPPERGKGGCQKLGTKHFAPWSADTWTSGYAQHMQLTCPRCAKTVRGGDVNEKRGIASCRACGELIELEGRTLTSEVEPKPRGLLWEEHAEGATRRIITNTPDRLTPNARLFGLVSAILIVAFEFVMPFFVSRPGPDYVWILMSWPVGFGVGYLLLRRWLTRTILVLNEGTLLVREEPLPGRGSQKTGPVTTFSVREAPNRYGVHYFPVARSESGETRLPFMFTKPEADYAVYRLNELLAETRASAAVTGYRVSSIRSRELSDGESLALDASKPREGKAE